MLLVSPENCKLRGVGECNPLPRLARAVEALRGAWVTFDPLLSVVILLAATASHSTRPPVPPQVRPHPMYKGN